MVLRPLRLAIVACCFVAGVSCSSATEPGAGITFARRLWLTRHPQNYEFETATASSWFNKSGYSHVQVAAGKVVAATDSAGKPILITMTIDSLWNAIVTAKQHGLLYVATFDHQGVPLEAQYDFCQCGDANLHIWVRNFVIR